MLPLIVLLVITSLLQLTSTLPNGAPTSVCDTLLPFHGGGIPRQTSPSLFRLTPFTTRVGQGQTMRIEIESNPPELAFGGFMIHARSTSPPFQVVGRFNPTEDSIKLISCDGGPDNTATHTNTKDKKNLGLEWEAPTDFTGTVIFNATVAQKYETFWVGIESPLVEVIQGTGAPVAGISTTRPPLTTTRPNFIPPAVKALNDTGDPIYQGCGDSKGCFGFPDGCVAKKSCLAIAVIHVQGERYQFELKTGFPHDKKRPAFVALGLSSDMKMGADSVMECVPENGVVKAFTSYTSADPYSSERTGISQNIIKLLESSYNDGTIYCKIERQTVSSVRGTTFDLVNDKYHLLLATGENLKENSVGYHFGEKLASGQLTYLSDTAEFKGASVLLLRLHGAFMVIAWIGTASLGILFARYFKQTWVGGQMCGKDHWFVWHRLFMVLTWLLTMAGFVLIFVDIGQWSNIDNPHPILGLITTILCFLQPIGALFRPAPTSRNRPYFNWGHWLGGNLAHILSIATIFYAVQLTKAELPGWLDWILVAFVAFHVFMHLVFSIAGCASDNHSGKRVTAFPMTDLSPARGSMGSDRKQDAPYSKLRKFLLAFYIIIIVLFVVALVLIVVLAPIASSLDSFKSKIMN